MKKGDFGCNYLNPMTNRNMRRRVEKLEKKMYKSQN